MRRDYRCIQTTPTQESQRLRLQVQHTRRSAANEDTATHRKYYYYEPHVVLTGEVVISLPQTRFRAECVELRGRSVCAAAPSPRPPPGRPPNGGSNIHLCASALQSQALTPFWPPGEGSSPRFDRFLPDQSPLCCCTRIVFVFGLFFFLKKRRR